VDRKAIGMRTLIEGLETLHRTSQFIWDHWTTAHGWEAPDVRVVALLPENPGRSLMDVWAFDLSGLGRAGVVSVPKPPLVPVDGGRKLTRAQAAQAAQAVATAKEAHQAVTAALGAFDAAAQRLHGAPTFAAAWAGLQAAAAHANQGLPAGARFTATAVDAVPPRLARWQQPVGLQHNDEEITGDGITLSYTWPRIALRTLAGGDLAVHSHGAGRFAVATLFARWLDRHAAEIARDRWTAAQVRASLAAERVPVDFALPKD
jgi:hypothetical protein